jgi:hypothetical protein
MTPLDSPEMSSSLAATFSDIGSGLLALMGAGVDVENFEKKLLRLVPAFRTSAWT